MAPLLITCTGTSTLTHAPELAVVHLTISSTGPSQPAVTQDVTQTSAAIASHLKTLTLEDDAGTSHPTAPVTHWTLSSLSTGSWIPPPEPADEGDKRTEKPPRLFTASITMSVTFGDFSALGSFSGNLASADLVRVERVEWELRAETTMALARRGRREAVRDAMAKAKDYADAVGKADFAVLEISDVGWGGGGGGGGGGGRMMMGFARGGAEEVSFRPEDVCVSCEVTAKFDAA